MGVAWIHDALGYAGFKKGLVDCLAEDDLLGIEIVVSGEWKGFVFYDLDVNYCAGSGSPRMALAMGRIVKDSKGTTMKSCLGQWVFRLSVGVSS